jgi:hypothetical protein
MTLKEIKDAARKAFSDQQTQDTEGGVPDGVSFVAGFLAGFRHIESAFNDRCKVIEMQLEDKKKLEEENKKLREALSLVEMANCYTDYEDAVSIAKEALKE